jgi:hypothetical protein
LTAEEAFRALKRQSRSTNINLHTTADKISGGPACVYRVKLVVLLIAVGLGPKVAVNVRDLRATHLLPPRPNRDGSQSIGGPL